MSFAYKNKVPYNTFKIPSIWLEPEKDHENCFFCSFKANKRLVDNPYLSFTKPVKATELNFFIEPLPMNILLKIKKPFEESATFKSIKESIERMNYPKSIRKSLEQVITIQNSKRIKTKKDNLVAKSKMMPKSPLKKLSKDKTKDSAKKLAKDKAKSGSKVKNLTKKTNKRKQKDVNVFKKKKNSNYIHLDDRSNDNTPIINVKNEDSANSSLEHTLLNPKLQDQNSLDEFAINLMKFSNQNDTKILIFNLKANFLTDSAKIVLEDLVRTENIN